MKAPGIPRGPCDNRTRESILKKIYLVLLVLAVAAGCARTWQFQAIDAFRPADGVPAAAVCQGCHGDQYGSWKENRHSSEERMAAIPVTELHECGACHAGLTAHVAEPAKTPARRSPRSRRRSRTRSAGNVITVKPCSAARPSIPMTSMRFTPAWGLKVRHSSSHASTVTRDIRESPPCWSGSRPISAISAIPVRS